MQRSCYLTLLTVLCASGFLFAAEVETDPLTKQLMELIRTADKQAGTGDGTEAIATLEKAKALAAEAKRPEAAQIEARIQRLKDGIAQQKQVQAAVTAEAQKAPAPVDPNAAPAAATAERPKIRLIQDECVEIAVQNNLGLRLKRLTDRATDLTLDSAWADYLPTITSSLNHSGNVSGGADANSTSLGFDVTQKSPWGTTVKLSASGKEEHPLSSSNRSGAWGVEVSQPLWKGFGTDVGMYTIRSARLGKLISRGNLELSIQDVIFQTQTAYSDCIRQTQNLEVNQRAVESAKVFLRLTQVREKAGQQTRLDVYNAEVQLADRELAVISTRRALEEAYDTLKQVMDVDLEESVEVESSPVDFGENPPAGEERNLVTDDAAGTVKRRVVRAGTEVGEPFLMFQAQHFDDEKVLAQAMANRIDLLNGKRNVALQELTALLKKDGLGQQVDLTASYGRDGSGRQWSQARGFETDGYALGLKYTLPWGKIKDKTAYEAALLQVEQADIELKQVRTSVHHDVRTVLRNLVEGEKSILIQAKKVEQAKRSVEAEKIRFERGLKDSFDVITAEDNLLQAKTAFINLTVTYIVKLNELQKVIGKPTGRVDLLARTRGGEIRTSKPDTLTPERTPKPAPEPDKTINDRY